MRAVLAKNLFWTFLLLPSRDERHGGFHQEACILNKSNKLSAGSFGEQPGLLPGLGRPAKPRGSCKEQLGYSQVVVFQPLDRFFTPC
jgi:hypothetical protein